jgi:hypothetical protein
MSVTAIKFIGALLTCAIFFAVTYGWARSLSNPLTVIQKKILVFGDIFFVGVCFFILWRDEIFSVSHMPHLYFVGIVLWAILSGFITSRTNFKDPDDQSP